MKYPLTEQAKQTAIRFSEAWKEGRIEQLLYLYLVFAMDGEEYHHFSRGTNGDFDAPCLSSLMELSEFRLLVIKNKITRYTAGDLVK